MKKIIFFILSLVIIFALFGCKKNDEKSKDEETPIDIDPNAKDWTEKDPIDKGGEKVGIKVPGYQYITIEKDTTNVKMELLNPEGNPCYFKFEICLKETGEVLYTSKLVPPGQVINDVTLSRGLSAGEYKAIIKITTVSTTDGTAMNGANVETTLIAQ